MTTQEIPVPAPTGPVGEVAPPPAPEAAQPTAVGAEAFPTRKAIDYSMANLGASVFYGLFNFGMPLYLDTYHLDQWLIGLLANERSFIGAFVQPIVGRISDRTHTRFGKRRPFFLIGIPLVSVGLLLLAFHPPFWVMLAVMSVLAFFLSVAWDPYMAMMADIFTPLQRGRVAGFVGAGTGLGNIIFALLALTLWGNAEFGVFMLVIGALLVTWTYTFFRVKETPPPGYVPEAAAGAPAPGIMVETRASKKTWGDRWALIRDYIRDLREQPEAAKYVGAMLFWWLGTGGVLPFVTLFGTKVLGASTEESFILPLAGTITNALVALPAGLIADRTSKKKVMIAGMLAFGLFAAVGSQAQTLWQGVIVLTLAGGAMACLTLINAQLTDLVPPKRMAEFIGIGSSVFSLAQPLGSVVAGAVVTIAIQVFGAAEHDAYRLSFIWAGIMVAIGAVLLLTVHPERVATSAEAQASKQ